MSSTSSDAARRPRHLSRGHAAAALVLATAGCSLLPGPAHPRPPLPLPAEIEHRYALPGAVVEESLIPIGGADGIAFFRGRLSCGNERTDFHFLRPAGETAAPLLLCLPILAGGDNLMWMVATSMARRGYATAWTERAGAALQPPQRAPELEELFRRTVVQNRMLLAWARRSASVDPDRMACLGISMGGIVGGVLLAVEPDLRGGALCLAGGDLPSLLMASGEDRVVEWRRWRHLEDGSSGTELLRELRQHLVSDPALLGPYVATDRVLLIGGAFDEVVPPRFQDALWESLGRPERHSLPFGHYTAALAFGSIVTRVDLFLRRRLVTPEVGVAGRHD